MFQTGFWESDMYSNIMKTHDQRNKYDKDHLREMNHCHKLQQGQFTPISKRRKLWPLLSKTASWEKDPYKSQCVYLLLHISKTKNMLWYLSSFIWNKLSNSIDMVATSNYFCLKLWSEKDDWKELIWNFMIRIIEIVFIMFDVRLSISYRFSIKKIKLISFRIWSKWYRLSISCSNFF